MVNFTNNLHNGEIYFGCDGSFKRRMPIEIQPQGPEYQTWKRKIDKTNENFEPCFGDENAAIFPQGQCIITSQSNQSSPKLNDCRGEEEFWDEDELICDAGKNLAIASSSEQCKGNIPKIGKDGVGGDECWSKVDWYMKAGSRGFQYKFCRKKQGNSNCIYILMKEKQDYNYENECNFM